MTKFNEEMEDKLSEMTIIELVYLQGWIESRIPHLRFMVDEE